MPIKEVITSQRVPIKIWTDEVDEKSKQQLANIASLSFIHHHVAAMPDVHVGIGATIGSVIATHKAIIPAAVGVGAPGRRRPGRTRSDVLRWSQDRTRCT